MPPRCSPRSKPHCPNRKSSSAGNRPQTAGNNDGEIGCRRRIFLLTSGAAVTGEFFELK